MARTLTPAQVAGGFGPVDPGPQPDHTADDPVPAVDPAPAVDPVAVPDPPDPERVAPLTLGVMGSLVSLFEQLGGILPMAHSLSRTVSQARIQFDQLVFHSTPPADQPPK